MAAMMGAIAGIRPRGFSPTDYDLLSWLRLGRRGGVDSWTLEPGTEDSTRRIQSVSDPGSVGGAYVQGNSLRRPEVALFRSGRAIRFGRDGSVVTLLGSTAPASAFDALIDPASHTIVAAVVRLRSFPNNFQRIVTTRALGRGFTIEANSTGRLRAAWNDTESSVGAQDVDAAGALTAGATHVIVVEREATAATVRVDGSTVATGTITLSPTTSQHPMTVGARPDAATTTHVDGFVSCAMAFAGANLPDIGDLETYRARFPLDDPLDDWVLVDADDDYVLVDSDTDEALV